MAIGVTSTRKDPLSVLEAAYSFEPDERAWMEGIVRAAQPYALGGGVAAATIELGSRSGYRSMVVEDVMFDPKTYLGAMQKVSTTTLFRRAHVPMPIMFSADLLTDILRQEGVTREELAHTASDLVTPNAWGVVGGDASAETFLLFFPTDNKDALRAPDRAALDAMGAHLGAALRLRSLLESRAPSADDDTTEAVIAPCGKILDARGAKATGSLTKLVEAAKRTERARSRKATPEERLVLWTAIFDGQWSIVDSTENDGKRMLLACRNEPRTTPMRKLSPRERSVVAYAALGHSYKYIAYELGLSVSAVSSIARGSIRKLGLKSRAELIRAFGTSAKEDP